MSLIVQKFGGTSVATAERIMAAARRAIRAQQAGHQVVVVVSARGDTTDDLLALAHEITDQPPARELDMLLATGEQISIALMAMAIHVLGGAAESLTGGQVGIVTTSAHTKARIKTISMQRIRRALDRGHIAIVAGFQGVDEEDNITTLGRGGSDTTAVALAAVLKHDPAGPRADVQCEIFTDVDGVYTTDPRLVPEAQKLSCISCEEMLELASLGAGVMHSRAIEFAQKFNVPLQVRSAFSDVEGTWIVPEQPWMSEIPVRGVAIVRDEARVRISGLPDHPGLVDRIFSALAQKNLVVDMIAAGVDATGLAEVGFTVLRNELSATLAALAPIARALGGSVSHSEDHSKISICGIGMRTHTGVAQAMFEALATANISVQMVSTSDIKISALVAKSDGLNALRAVHRAFALHAVKDPPEAAGVAGRIKTSEANGGAELSTWLANLEEIVVRDVHVDDSQARLAVFGLPDQPEALARIFGAVALAGIVVDLIVYNVNDAGRAELSFTIPRADADRAQEQTTLALQTLRPGSPVLVDRDLAMVTVTGIGMRTHTGVAQGVFARLAELGINITLISTSETRISVAVPRERGAEAAAALRQIGKEQ